MHAQTVAQIITKQIGQGVLMSLGARNLRYSDDALIFDASILPITKTGKRGTTARTMRVVVSLNQMDTYDILVSYPQRGDRYGLKPAVIHYDGRNIYADQLASLMLALDYNGRDILNPRLAA